MGISVGSDYYLNGLMTSRQSAKASSLASSLSGLDAAEASDEELLEACKGFEAYLVEQMLKGMKNTIPKDKDEKENDYLTQFGDMLYQNVAETIADKGELGLANELFEAMKRNQNLV